MAHQIHWVASFEKLATFTSCVEFTDGTSQTIDFLPVLKGELDGPLQDLALFEQVRVDPEVRTLVGPTAQTSIPLHFITGQNWSCAKSDGG